MPATPPWRVARGQTNAAPRGQASPPRSGVIRTGATAPVEPQGQAAPPAPKAPFTLTESQDKLLEQILLKWEKQSDRVKTFKCAFTRWEIDPTFGPEKNDYTASEAKGNIKYKSPDRGEYRVDEVIRWDQKKLGYQADQDSIERWICDGEAIYEFDFKKKQLKVRMLPEQMKGKAISDGPLPFIFGAKADQLKRRYWMRDVTPKEEVGKTIWLEAFPKYQQDAANFQSATVILKESDFMPFALRVFMPGGKANSDYQFASTKVNDPLAVFNFIAPRLSPWQYANGWKHVVDAPKESQAEGEAKQATRAQPAARK